MLAACAAPQPLSLSALAEALGDSVLDGATLACEAGLCRKLPGGKLAPAGPATLDMAVNLLEVPEVRATCARLAPLAASPDETLLLMLAADPLGEGLRLLEAAPGRAASMVKGVRHALESPSALPLPAPWDFGPWGAQASWASALLATAAHVLVRMGHAESGHALVAWALGPEGLTGRVKGAHGFLAPTHFQFLLDTGRREAGVAFAREALGALDDGASESTYARRMLTVLEGRVAMDAGDEKLARRLFTTVETQARAAGLGDMVGLAKVAFATLARRAEQNTAAIQLGLAALELLCGEVPFESVALLGLGHAYSREGRHLDAQASLTRALPGLDIPFQQLRAYPQAIATDCFLGDTAEAERKLAALVALAADTPQARLALGLGRAHLQCARGAREAALAEWRRLTEPLSPEARGRFRRAYDRPKLLALLGEAPTEELSLPEYLRGGSAAFRAAMTQLRRVASSDTSVLLFGETGVGKELAARAIHDLSRRSAGPFVAVNCAAINDELLLSDLFGHERGSFTGAVARQRGRFEQAHGGTLFLDEVADISPRGQAALLRALQEKAFQRVGGTEEVRVDVRVVAASNRNLAKAVRGGEFRQDLFFRLNGIHVELPPLRERDEDVLLLATHFLQQAAQERGGPAKSFSPEAERLLRAHPWPGNVRELHNTVRAADVLSDTPAIGAAVLAPLLQRALECAEPRPAPAGMTDLPALFRQHGGSLRDFLSEVQRQCIAQSLVENGGNVVATAAALRISRSRLTQVVLGNAELRRMSGREQDATPAPSRLPRARRA